MSYQKRIDEYYKCSSKVANIKKRSRSKDTTEKRNVKRESEDKLDCTIVYENLNASSDTLESMEISRNISMEEDFAEEMSADVFDTIGGSSVTIKSTERKEEARLECFSNFNQKPLTNNSSTQLQRTPTKSPGKPVTPRKSSSSHSNGTPSKRFRIGNRKSLSPRNSTNSFSTPKKMSPGKSPEAVARKRLFSNVIDDDLITRSIKHMNLARQGVIPPHCFNLEEIYSRQTFYYRYPDIEIANVYELNDIDLCDDLNLKILFTTIFKVFSDPINCGYFDEVELDFIYSIITLPADAKMLLARMLKRKRGWFRKSSISYPEIATDLRDTFKILVSRSICTFDIASENLTAILELLQTKEINQLCRKFKLDSKGKKEDNIKRILKLAQSKPLFSGMKCLRDTLCDSILEILEYCVCVANQTWNIIDRIVTLLMPDRDPKLTMSDIYFALCDVYLGKTVYPDIRGYYFPVFSNSMHLISYVEVKNILHKVISYIEKKDWEQVRTYGNLAMDVLPNVIKTESLRLKDSKLPMHVRRYMLGYVWLKILSACIEAYKRETDKTRVVDVLTFLLEQDCHLHARKGRWYAQLALIEMHHQKNIEKSASIVTRALDEESLTQVDKVDLLERINKILKRKVGLTPNTRTSVSRVLDNFSYCMPKYNPASTTINSALMTRNTAGKSVWRIESNSESESYGSVETLAFHYYRQQGFPNGLHCEGALPIILFFTLFWEELYDIHVPGAFATPYQDAPSDLFTEHFHKNRKDRIDTKLQIVRRLDSESLSCLLEEKFQEYKQYKSVMSSSLQDNVNLKEIVQCLGETGVVGICERLLDNFNLWKAGFPDLIVWNYSTKEHKIVEVKGPRDSLSTKQRLWLEYLHRIGLNTEICLVEGKLRSYGAKASATVTVQGPWKWYSKFLVAGVVSKLNSATGTPRWAACGANIAAGYTTDDVPITRQTSHSSTAAKACSSVRSSRLSPNHTIWGLSRPLQSSFRHRGKSSTGISEVVIFGSGDPFPSSAPHIGMVLFTATSWQTVHRVLYRDPWSSTTSIAPALW